MRANVLSAKDRLADGHEELRRLHQSGASGVELCGRMSDLRDEVVLGLFAAALDDLGEAGTDGLGRQIALVALGGYGRREVAPFSDVDLMILRPSGVSGRVAPLADRMLRDVFDAGLDLGHSVRTVEEACRLACGDPLICASLVDARLLSGDERLFADFLRQFRRSMHRQAYSLGSELARVRGEERARYGETVFLLEPNVKRSRGGLRDVQLVHWLGCVRYGSPRLGELRSKGLLTKEDCATIERAGEFLLWLRNELHFYAGQGTDVLSRGEQLRIAEIRGFVPAAGLLPVEQFMRECFRHTDGVSHVVTRFEAAALARDGVARLTTALFGHRVERGVRVGPAGIMATRRGMEHLRGNLTAIVRLADLANLYGVSFAPTTWDAIRREAPQLPDQPPSDACRYFLSLLERPGRLGPLLKDLHEAGVLERFVPEFAHVRGLLQFNQYHKYTVDEHCIRAVEAACEFYSDPGPLGRVYRAMTQKHILHLALLVHDLGKGYPGDHSDVGAAIAERAAERLGLASHDTEAVKFLVQNHLVMNHLAFRRDTGDEELVMRFAVQVGSPELLRMLYVMTAADLSAVGPGVWDAWKDEIVTQLYHRAVQYLAVDSPATVLEERLQQAREAVRAWLGDRKADRWFTRQVELMPSGYLNNTGPHQVAADLRMLHDLAPGQVTAEARYLPELHTVLCTVGTTEQVTPGIFHKLTGALSSRGLEIRSAHIYTLGDGLVLDRFWVHDPDYAAAPPPDRLEEIEQALVQSLVSSGSQPPTFRRTRQMGGREKELLPRAKTRVNLDNTTSDQYTVLDIFTHDRTGLLYAIARTLFELGLSVWRAKIGTFLDQVVDVFYVTDQDVQKIDDPARMEEIRQRLVEVIESQRAPGDLFSPR